MRDIDPKNMAATATPLLPLFKKAAKSVLTLLMVVLNKTNQPATLSIIFLTSPNN